MPTKKRKPRTELRNGCSRTEVFIFPKNYKSLRNKSDLDKDWFVACRFFDPKFAEQYPKGFQFRKRVNEFEDIQERKYAAEHFKRMLESQLDEKHYNPITKTFMYSDFAELRPDMDTQAALQTALQKVSGSANYTKQIKWCVNNVLKAMKALNYDILNIEEIRLHHIKNSLEFLNLSDYTYNKFLQYLKRIFDELIEYGCADHNPCRDIRKKKYIQEEQREVISDEQLKFIDPYLKHNYPEFYRYRMIFGYSAGRSSELMKVRKKDVRLEEQEFVVQIQKGRKAVWKTKIITLDAVPFWKEILDLAENDDDYLFSVGLIPGEKAISPSQITRRWNRLVKKTSKILDDSGNPVKVTADFYTLKHKFLDELDALEDAAPIIPLAQAAASHTTNRTTGIYATGRERRNNEKLKQLRLAQ